MIRIKKAGFFSTIQDEGRFGLQAYGVNVAGAVDRYAYNIANLLVGNKKGAAALEMTMLGDSLEFLNDHYVAIGGADMQATLDDVAISNWSSFAVKAGSILSFGYAKSGCRAYLAVRGGIDAPLVLGSRSTYTRGKIGGKDGRTLSNEDTLEIGREFESETFPQVLSEGFSPTYGSDITLRVLLGPQDDMFTAGSLETFFANQYTITNECDRMGYRLEGAKLEHKKNADIISDALPLGAIQVPAHGMPIVMLADRQTTGGYAKIGTVISPDLSKLAQGKPGDKIKFLRVTQEQAVDALREEREIYQKIKTLAATTPDMDKKFGEFKIYRVVVNQTEYELKVREVLK